MGKVELNIGIEPELVAHEDDIRRALDRLFTGF